MQISFIVPLYNEIVTISQCLNAITAEMSQDDEIIVVDNGSFDGSLEEAQKVPGVKVIKSLATSISGVRNAGARAATRDYLAFIDADCTICENWRKHVVETLSSPAVSAAGSKVDIPDDACWIEKAWFSQRRKKITSANYINSGNLVVRKNLFENVGCFDEGLVTGEDAELCMRIILSGGVIIENPGIKSIHLGNPRTIRGFFKKQRWHGLGMLGTFNLSVIDKPLFMTVYFIVSLLLVLSFTVKYLFASKDFITLFLIVFFLLSASVLTTIFRIVQFKNNTYFFHLIFLYFIYYVARTIALMQTLYEKWPSKKRTATY